jgi:hypothetical protein
MVGMAGVVCGGGMVAERGDGTNGQAAKPNTGFTSFNPGDDCRGGVASFALLRYFRAVICDFKLGRSTNIYLRSAEMNMNFALVGPPLISLLAGISILLWPRLLSYIVAFYLILFGLVGLLPLMM